MEDTEDEEEAAALIDMPAPEPIAAVATPIVVPTLVMFDPETKAAVGRALRTVPFAAVAAPEPVKPKSRPKRVFTSDENVGTVIKRKKKTEKRNAKRAETAANAGNLSLYVSGIPKELSFNAVQNLFSKARL